MEGGFDLRWCRSGPPHRRAATLAEVLVALAVFSLFALAIMSAITQAYRLNAKDAEVSQVTQLANRVVEQSRLVAMSSAGYEALESIQDAPIAETSYLYDVDVVELNPELKKVTVLLRRSDSDPLMTLSTVVSRP